MKHSFGVTLCILALAAAPAISQTESGCWELSLAGNMGSISSSSEYTSGGQTRSDEGEAHGYFGLAFRTGYFVTDGLSLEPEFYMLAQEKVQPTFNIGGNLAYTFTIPESPVRPFLTAGYGIGNGVPLMQRLLGRSSSELDIPVVRAGGGLKVLVSPSVALKVEYRYERYSQEETYPPVVFGGYTYMGGATRKEVSHFNNILIGFSVFLGAGE